CLKGFGSPNWALLTSRPRHRLVAPHEEFRIFLEDIFGDLLCDVDDCTVVSLLPGLLEAGANSLQTEDLQLSPLEGSVLLELLEQSPFTELLKVLGFIRVGDIPAVLCCAQESRVASLKARVWDATVSGLDLADLVAVFVRELQPRHDLKGNRA